MALLRIKSIPRIIQFHPVLKAVFSQFFSQNFKDNRENTAVTAIRAKINLSYK